MSLSSWTPKGPAGTRKAGLRGARAALDMGMDRAFVSSIYGEELTARAEGQAKLPLRSRNRQGEDGSRA